MKYLRVLQTFTYTALVCWCLGQTPMASAALLDLSDVPLFLGFQVEPNIFFVIDDSGSMDWEVVSKDASSGGIFTGTQPDGSNPSSAGSVKHRDGDDDGDADCAFGDGQQYSDGYLYVVEFEENTYADGSNDCNTADDQAWRMRNSDFNPLYFDPNRTYQPWAGVDANGNPFQNMPITAAKANPYNPNSDTIDLTRHNSNWPGGSSRATSDRNGDGVADGFRYYTWTDLDNDGRFDNGEETEHLIKDADAATQQNFANWFSYHRKREYVAKAAYGEVIAQARGVRMGLSTLNNNNSVETRIKSMNEDPTTGNKRALLDKLYSINSVNGTPLRSAMKDAGRYLECVSNGISSTCPRLLASEGGACQQNFSIVMTDGFWNGSSPSLGNTDGPPPTSTSKGGNSAWDGRAYGDSYSNTLADVAMHFYERDLDTNLANTVPITPGVDEAKHQHVVTYTVAFGVNGSLSANPPNKTDKFNWPDPFDSDAYKIDDLRHAAFNGRGEFLDASNPANLVDALNGALSSIADRTGSAASVALNSGAHNAGSRIYQARFNSGDWSGQLLAFPLDEAGDVLEPDWDAGAKLDTILDHTTRTIVTYDRAATQGVPFQWNTIGTAMQNLLDLNASGVDDNQGEARLLYLRGDKSNEGQFRIRPHQLGDLINSDPFFVADPLFPDSLGTGYGDFRKAYKGRTPMVYVGGNDGMLHGFNATVGNNANKGKEELAYVPRALYSRLSQLTSPSYKHLYFVDGSPTVGDAYGDFGSTRCPSGSSCWRSVLVSGLRHGGQAMFALNVTDPSTFQESNAAKLALWEFSDADDADLGYTFSQPSIVRMANGKWAAVFGNGYNNSEADGHASSSGHAVLFIVFLDQGLDGTWTLGTDYIKLDTGVGSTTTPNGLATPAPIDLDGDFTVEYIYAGDLRGNLWRFDVSNANPGNWSAPARLFTAKYGSLVQPITSRPEVGRHQTDPDSVLVYFGTGKYLETADNTNTGIPTQTFYAIWDQLESSPTIVTHADLLEQEVIKEVSAGSFNARILTDKAINWSGDTPHRGWYVDLPISGERQVSDSILRNNRIIFTTLIPSVDVCTFGGDAWLMEIDAFSGGRIKHNGEEETPFDINEDGKFDENDLVTTTIDGEEKLVAVNGVQSTEGILPTPAILFSGDTELKYNSGASGDIFVTTENPGSTAHGRQAWRQLQ
jgi:type IV pilus assembly protein PilY1